MRAAKMLCAQKRKKPVAMGSGGKVKNPVAKGLSDSKFKPRVVKPKKGKGSYSRKGKALSYSSGGKTKSKVNEAGNYTKPGMRKRLFNEIKAGGKGGARDNGQPEKLRCWLLAIKKRGAATRTNGPRIFTACILRNRRRPTVNKQRYVLSVY